MTRHRLTGAIGAAAVGLALSLVSIPTLGATGRDGARQARVPAPVDSSPVLDAQEPDQASFSLLGPLPAFVAGAIATHTLTLSSTTGGDETVSFRAAGGVWPVELPDAVVLPGGGRVSASVVVSVPFDAGDRMVDTVDVAAVSSGGTTVSATLTTRTGGVLDDDAYVGCRYDLDRDGRVGLADVAAVAARYNASRGTSGYERALDFNHDGRIGNGDVQTVAGRFGTECRTVPAVDASALTDAVTVEAIREHLEALQAIADANDDNRSAGTAGYGASRAYIEEALAGAGLSVVTTTFGIPFFEVVTPPILEQVSPSSKTYSETDFRVFTNSPSGDVTAEVQAVDVVMPPGSAANTSTSGCEASDFTDFEAGRIALLQRGTCTFATKSRNAQRAGAVGVLVYNEGQPNRRDVFSSAIGSQGNTIPAFSTSFSLGEELYTLLETGSAVRLRMAVETLSGSRPDYSVVAEVPGGRDDRVVVIGGHLDSVGAGPGINDNGSGTATMLETALQLARVGIEPVNRLRFAFWGGEELGLLGSEAYVESLAPAEREAVMLNLNFDMIGSPNFGRFIYDGDGSNGAQAGPEGSAEIERVFQNYLENRGLESEPTSFDGRSDYGPFIAVDIPAGGLFTGAEGRKTAAQAGMYGGTAGNAFDACYHRACDTIDNIAWDVLDEMADAVAHATYTYALDDGFAYTRAETGVVAETTTASATSGSGARRANLRLALRPERARLARAGSARRLLQGDALDVDVYVTGAEGLASFEATLLYDTAVLSPTGATLGPMVPPESIELGPVMDAPGTLAIGSYNTAGQSTGGDGLIATVSFVAVGGGAADVRLAPTATGATDRLGEQIDAALALGLPHELYLPALRREEAAGGR